MKPEMEEKSWMKKSREALTDTIRIRRYLHENPELSGHETGTVAFICKELSKKEIPYINIPDGGVLAELKGGMPGKNILLRADCDALPIMEGSQNACRLKSSVSHIPGIAHMCGHDAHTAMLLSAAGIIKQKIADMEGTVYLLFERGEEAGGCIYYVIKYIEEQNIQVDACWAVHVVPDLETGKVAIQGGITNAAVFDFDICLKGKGGHGSRPDLASNPIGCFADLVNLLKDFRIKEISPFHELTWAITRVSAGTAINIIPDELRFSGTCRYFEMDDGKNFKDYLARCLDYACVLNDCRAERIVFQEDYVPCVCCEELAQFGRQAVSAVIGEENIIPRGKAMGSESFAALSMFFPCASAKVGVRSEEKGCVFPVHTPGFDIDEDALVYGIFLYTAFALCSLLRLQDIEFERRFNSIDAMFKYMNRNIPERYD